MMNKLVETLINTKLKGDKTLQALEFDYVMQDGEYKMIMIDLASTIYDYELRPEKMMKYLEQLFFCEWYDSTTIHVYPKEVK